jgi:osmotically-inducible protein OsmY
VAVTGDTAVLSGEVQQLWQKEAAAVVTRRFRIHTLRNDITVIGP